MASEVQRPLDAKKIGYQKVAENILTSAKSKSPELIDQSINSFTTIPLDHPSKLQSYFQRESIPEAGFVDSPFTYFLTAGPDNSQFEGMTHLHRVVEILRHQDLNFQNGVKAFLRIGIQEALNGLKLIPNPKIPSPMIAPPLDELLTPDKLKNPDRALLQYCIRAINNMFSALRNMQKDHSDFQFTLLHRFRA